MRLAKQRAGRERCEGCGGCCANGFGLPRQALRTEVPRRKSSPALACEILCCDGELLQERCRRQHSLRAQGRKPARALPHSPEKILFIIPGVTKGVARVEPRWEVRKREASARTLEAGFAKTDEGETALDNSMP